MDSTMSDATKNSEIHKKKLKNKFNLRYLRISLKYRPEILKLVLKMRHCIKKKSVLLKKTQKEIKLKENAQNNKISSSTQTENNDTNKPNTIIINHINKDVQTDHVLAANLCNSPKAMDPMEIDDNLVSKIDVKDSSTQTDDIPIIHGHEITNLNSHEEKDVQTDEELANCNLCKRPKAIATTQIDDILHTKIDVKDLSTQTDNIPKGKDEVTNHISQEVTTETSEGENKSAGWNVNKSDEEGKSIAEQVKEAAQSALQQTGMVYVESAGMYYDYKTGYYYNSELGLYYHTDTGCYYCYSEDKKEFVFHSYPDRSALAANASLDAHERRKARKQKKAWKTEEEVDNLTKTFSQDKEDEASKPKRMKKSEKKKVTIENSIKDENTDKDQVIKTDTEKYADIGSDKKGTEKEDLEDGECSETASEAEEDDAESVASTSTASDDDAVAKHHPPCMRVIVRDTNLPKLKVGTLFLVTKDGGTVGREGDHHTILIRDHNVSRNHLDIRYDMDRRMYMVTDLGSKNGTLLNGIQMSGSQVVSKPMEVIHGSTLQLGETKLLCHIHPGNDTCGHCEPGLLMETQEKEKVAYTRTCTVQKQYHLELARLKNKFAPEPLMIEEGTYNDRAKARREAVGSSHHSEKTQSTDVDTCIASENKGFKLLEKMGWSKGEGLGKDNQGHVEPVPLVSNEGKAGLGTPGSVGAPTTAPVPKIKNTLGPATLRLATRSKLLQPPAKAFQDPLEDNSE